MDYENTPFAPSPRGPLGRTVISLNRTTDQNIVERMKDFLFPIQEKLHICFIVGRIKTRKSSLEYNNLPF